MVIALDAGNSRIKAGFSEGGSIVSRATPTHPLRSAEEYVRQLGLDAGCGGVVVATVVEEVRDTLNEMARMVSGRDALFVDHRCRTGLSFRVDRPETIGPDRIANAVGACTMCKGGVIVVDLGSATTVTVVGERAEFMGGCIMPGIGMMAGALHEKTSRLPLVDVAGEVSIPGKDTEASILAGLVYGTAGAVERMIAEIRRKMDYTMTVVMTGGLSGYMEPYVESADIVDPLLTLKGLLRIYDHNVP